MPTKLLNGRTLHFPSSPDENLAWSTVGQLVVTFSKPGEVSDERFNACVEAIAMDTTTTILATGLGKVVATSVQRKAIADAVKGKATVAVLDGNPIARGIITALGWFGANIKSFTWDNLEGAAEEVLVEDTTPAEIKEIVWKLRQLTTGESP